MGQAEAGMTSEPTFLLLRACVSPTTATSGRCRRLPPTPWYGAYRILAKDDR
jgi:hypothetical protein